MSTFLACYSVAGLGRGVRGTLYFPGRAAIPPGSAGYVRSRSRARAAASVVAGLQPPDATLPWRDYPPAVLTPSSAILPAPFEDDFLLIGCRNVLNEWGYQLRLDRTWWRRAGDPPVDESWPVLATLPEGVQFLRASDAEGTDADLVSGLPLVVDGRPCDRAFFVANCSDVSHTFEVHPAGLLGPSSEAWQELSDTWQNARDEGRPDGEIAAAMAAAAGKLGVVESRNNLHSLIAQTPDGGVLAVALTGSLQAIARILVERWNVHNAILLDNGGSVGWLYCPKGLSQGTLLIAGANRREEGTVFLGLRIQGFPKPRMHDALDG